MTRRPRQPLIFQYLHTNAMRKHGIYMSTPEETRYLSDLVLSQLPAIFGRIAAGGPSSKFNPEDLQRYLQTHLDHTASIASTTEAVWEIDDDHDGEISWDEFRTAMVRCLQDQHAREPQQVFNVVLFSVFSGGIGVLSQQSLKGLLNLRFGKELAEDKLTKGFGRDKGTGVRLDEFIHGMSSCIA